MEWTVVEESPSFYIAKINSALGYACLDKAHYEPMQEWVDVTKECALLEDGYGRYSLFHNGYAVEASNKRYKVTRNGCVVCKVEAQK
jgi:hypothetical protein